MIEISKIEKLFSQILRDLPTKGVIKTENIYEKEDIEEMLNNDEISPEEEGFMLGYLN